MGPKRREREMADMTKPWAPTVREGESIEDVPLSRWVGEALGAASMCWEIDGHQVSVGQFDSVKAKRINDALMARIEKSMRETIDRTERRVVDEVRSAVFSETGDNRITEAHSRITDESKRINKLRNLVHDLEGRIVEAGSATMPGMERAMNAIADRMRLMAERMAMIEDQYVTQSGFDDLIGRVRAVEERSMSMVHAKSPGWEGLVKRVNALEEDEVVMTVGDWENMVRRVNDLEAQSITVKIHTEDWIALQRRTDHIANRLGLYENQWSQTVTELKDRMGRFAETVDRLGLDVKNMREVEDARQRTHERNNENFGKRLFDLEQRTSGGVVQDTEAPHDFSYPIGAGAGKAERVATGMAAARREQYERGLMAGASKAIENAERRVRQHMESRFSQATIDDVIEALRGE